MVLGALLSWSIAVVATAVHTGSIRGDLAAIAQEIAHHVAYSGDSENSGRRYLEQRLKHLQRPLHVRSSSIRTIRRGPTRLVEVRLAAVVGFAIGGHPKIGISVVRSAPVGPPVRLP